MQQIGVMRRIDKFVQILTVWFAYKRHIVNAKVETSNLTITSVEVMGFN